MRDTTLFEKHSGDISRGIGLYYCGKRIKTKNHTYGPEIRTHYLIVLIEEGRAVLHGEKDIYMHRHDMLVMFPGERIHYEALTDWSIKWIGVFGEEPENVFRELGVTPKKPVIALENYAVLSKIVSDIYEVSDRTDLAGIYKCRALVNDFFANLCLASGDRSAVKPVQYAVGLIDYNYNTSIGVSTLAKAVNMDSAYFSRLFKSETGLSPKQYILKKRIEKACEMLENDKLSVKEIASSVGYCDPLYFCRVFKGATGLSPTAYRARRQYKKGEPIC